MAIIIKKKRAGSAAAPTPEPLVSRRPRHTLFDGHCKVAMQKSPNAIVPWWLMASYGYYIREMPILSDKLYDQMAVEMKARWKEIVHAHKHLITEAHLEAGSLFDLKAEDYPRTTVGAYEHLLHTRGSAIDLKRG